MTLRLVERLNAVRYRYFVGRNQECDLFRSALAAPEFPFSILYFFGSGGVGKTTLMRQLAQICQSARIPVTSLDSRTFEPSPTSFLKALQAAMHLAPDESPIHTLATQPTRHTLLIDSYERLASLEDWLREDFLPQLPDHVLIVLAGRCPPASAWRADLGWQALFHAVALQNLSSEESRLYLARRSIPTAHYPAIVDFAQGHPLALSLMADLCIQDQCVEITPDVTAAVIQALSKTFLEEVPSSTHRLALEACTVVRLTTEALLAELLGMPDVHDLFEWLRGLSFMEANSFGLQPHDIVREVVATDLRWRNQDRWEELHQRAQNYYRTRLPQLQGQAHHQMLWEARFLNAHQPHDGSVSTIADPSLSSLAEPPLLLNQPEFAQAVRDALRQFARPEALYHSPLLRSRLVIDQSAGDPSEVGEANRASRTAILQSRLREATELLQASPRDEKLYRVLHRTYLQPALTQEQAAELLDLPFSTYRRHLKAGVARVIEILWQREMLSA